MWCVFAFVLVGFGSDCMAIDVSVQYNGRFLADIIRLTLCVANMGNPSKSHEVFLSLQLLYFDIFSHLTRRCDIF